MRFDVIVRDSLPAGIDSKDRGGRTFWVLKPGDKASVLPYLTGAINQMEAPGKPLRCEFKVQDGCGITKMHEGTDTRSSRSSFASSFLEFSSFHPSLRTVVLG